MDFLKKIFDENIKLFQLFQKGKSLSELAKQNESSNNTRRAEWEKIRTAGMRKDLKVFPSFNIQSPRRDCHVYEKYNATIYDENTLMSELKSVTAKLKNNCYMAFGIQKPLLWYRGQKNAGYGLLPSLMRSTAKNKGSYNYLSQYQRHLFEEFKYRADGAPEIIERSRYSASDYLALMQHYNVCTNFMDWSEDAFTAIYFALEKLITGEETSAKHDASIHVFSPQLYNRARHQMISSGHSWLVENDEALKASISVPSGRIGEVPNIATKYNEGLYDVFLLGNVEYEKLERFGYKEEKKLDGKREMAFLPLAVYTSRLNPRIRSQSGMFLVYNLYAEPSLPERDAYKYLELEKIQDYYLTHCKDEAYQFLYKIKIKKEAVPQIAACFIALGLSKERVYPELGNVGEKIQ